VTRHDPHLALRFALELLCRKLNPPHRLATQPVDLAALGMAVPDLSRVPLGGTYLRGLRPGAVQLSEDPDQLDAAVLEGELWTTAKRAGKRLIRANLLAGPLPSDPDAAQHALGLLAQAAISLEAPASAHVNQVAVLPDGRIVTAGAQLVVWDVEATKPLRVLEGHRGWVMSVSSLGEGRVSSGGSDGTVRVWDVEGGGEARVLEGHRGEVWSVSSLGEGRGLSGGVDGFRVWNLETGLCEAWFLAVERDVVWRADHRGITVTHLTRDWRAVSRQGKLLPEDPVLHRWTGYVLNNLWALPVRHFPDLIEIDEENPRRFLQRYPPTWQEDETLIQRFLGCERPAEES